MHTAISCTTCTRPLRIPSTLLGQLVRCPYCIDEFVAVADPHLKLEEKVPNKAVAKVEEPAHEPVAVALLEPEPPVVEEVFTVDLASPVKPPKPPKPWSTWIFVRSDSDRRFWGEMQAEIGSEGLRLYRGRKELLVPVGCEATWLHGAVLRVVVGSRTVEFQLKKKHIYKSCLAADIAGFLNGDRPMPVNKGYGWPWYQWLLLLLPLGLLGVVIAGELPETPMKPLKGFGIFMLAVLGPLLAYALWHMERLRVGVRWTGASLLVAGAYLLSLSMYWFGPPMAATAKWHTYRPPDGSYTISMPAPPVLETEDFIGGVNVFSRTARVKPNQTFIVAHADLRGLFLHPAAQESALGQVRNYLRNKYPYSWISNEQPIHLDGYPGKELSVVPGSGKSHRLMTVRAYLVGNRLYILIVDDTIGVNGTKFLNSFRPDLPN
jgi:hypothetical protein